MRTTRDFIVSTCGTSVLTNFHEGSPSQEMRSILNRLTNKRESELSAEEKRLIDDHVRSRADLLEGAETELARKLSAEINGLAALHGGSWSGARAHHHVFVHSDTYLGRRCVERIAQWCEKQGLTVEPMRIPGMNTADFLSFQAAMSDLAHICATQFAPHRTPQCRVIFNLTGGFKSLQGFMQTLGMFYADEIIYLFESANEILRIPRLPLNIDNSALEEIQASFALFRRLSLQDKVMDLEGKNISESLLFFMEGEGYALSAWGQIFWDRYREKHYGDALLPSPLPDRIRFGQDFLKQAERFSTSREKLTELNERIDDLARYVLSGKTVNPKRLSFKALKGMPVPGSTHEFYAWSTSGAWRAFCHIIGDVIHIDTLRGHL